MAYVTTKSEPSGRPTPHDPAQVQPPRPPGQRVVAATVLAVLMSCGMLIIALAIALAAR